MHTHAVSCFLCPLLCLWFFGLYTVLLCAVPFTQFATVRVSKYASCKSLCISFTLLCSFFFFIHYEKGSLLQSLQYSDVN